MAKVQLPTPVPVPPATVRLSIAPEEWSACLDTWLTLVDFYLRLPTTKFSSVADHEPGPKAFLRSFYHETAHAAPGDAALHSPAAQKLRRTCFRLSRRLLTEIKEAAGLLEYEYLADFCHVHAGSTSLSRLMSELWTLHEKTLASMMQLKESQLAKAMDSSASQGMQTHLHQLPPIMLASPNVAASLMTGSDFLDSLALNYQKTSSPETQKDLTAIVYLGLQGLVKITPPNLSLLIDHLYSLKTQADGITITTSLLADLVTNTGLVARLRQHAGDKGGQRLLKLLDTLETYRSPSIARPKKHVQRRAVKGKGKGARGSEEMHMHQMSLVTQIQDLFPELGSSFVMKLLDAYGDDVEQVTAHLLDDSLPDNLRGLDRTEEAPIFHTNEGTELEHLAPRSTPPPPSESFVPVRRNVFDDDELDRLEVDASRLHLGKRTDHATTGQPNKAAIFSALATFDADDDERDDTYDVEDVGGTVDTAHPDGEPGPSAKVTSQENDMALFAAYKSSPQLFGRTTEIRRGQPRQALKTETGMTDEAIEGWAIMLQRDPKRLKRLEAQSGSFDGQQGELARTAYRESPAGTETEDSDVPAERGGFRGGGRGRGRGGRGRGNVAGPTSDPKTAAAQRNKEANKGSRANHNRRDQRARKMARGGFPG